VTRVPHAHRAVKQAKLALVALVAAGVLAGCGTHPGAAAVVGDQRISGAEVDAAAAALCSSTVGSAEAQGQPRPELASRGARQAAIQLMLDTELSRQFAEDQGIEPDQQEVSAALAQNAAAIEVLPAEERAVFRDLFRGFRESQLILAEAGRRSLAAEGNLEPAPEEVDAEGARLRQEWAADVEVEVDPRYGTYEQGAVNPTSGSLSIPASQRAFQGAQADPGTAWTAGLPLSQKC
jgi:hypothetical protein